LHCILQRIELLRKLTLGFQVVTVYTTEFNGKKIFLSVHTVYVLFIYLRTNNDYFPVQHQLSGFFYNRDIECLLRGRNESCMYVCMYTYMYLRGFKTSDDAFRLSYSIPFDCSIRPSLELFHSWLYTFHLSRFSGDGVVSSFLQVSSES